MRFSAAHAAFFLSFLPLAGLAPASSLGAEPLRTVAEASDYQATSHYADVIAFCERLARESPLVPLGELGKSQSGRKLPLVIIADPPVATPEEAARSGKMVVFAMGNIHAGEVDGKEGLLALARDLALAPKKRPLLEEVIVVLAPIFNADGNEQFGHHRPLEGGPKLVGVRENAQGLDLNRDFVKLETPEVRALVRLFNQWDPVVFIDCHTTNGSFHRYTMTYDGGHCPAGDPRVYHYVLDELLPDAGVRLKKHTGFLSFFYGNFSPDRSLWETVPPTPRYSTHYFGLRNRIGILSESYSYASYRDRVLASKMFVQSIFESVAANKDQVRKLLAESRTATIATGRAPAATDRVVLRQKAAPLGRPAEFLGFVEEKRNGHQVKTDKFKTYPLVYMGDSEPTLSVRRPYAYLFPASLTRVAENLQRHGIEVEELGEEAKLDVETYRIDKITRVPAFEKHQQRVLQATPQRASRSLKAGTILVRTAQPLGSLAAYILEPQTEDGLVTWNFLDDVIAEGKEYPIVRVPAAAAIKSARLRRLADER